MMARGGCYQFTVEPPEIILCVEVHLNAKRPTLLQRGVEIRR